MKNLKPKKCAFCGKEFIPNSPRQIYCKEPHYRICPICGREYLEDNNDNLKKPPVACSYECRAKKTRETSLKKYGIPAPGNNPVARYKAQITMQNKYGVSYTLQSEKLRDKANKTLIERYGEDNPSKIDFVKEKQLNTNRERYGDIMPFNKPESYQKQHETMMKRYGVPYFVLSDGFEKYGGNKVSKINKNFQQKLLDNGIKSELEFRIDTRSYDLHILDTNILIEIDPMYTHGGSGNHWNPNGIAPDYHLYKSLLAEDNGYRCIHVFDWDDTDKILNILKPKIKVSADSCQIWHLKLDVTNEFLDKYDLQGHCRNQLLCLGLVKDGEILQVMTFGKSVYDKKHNIVIRRMCTKFGFDVIGGFHKMLHYATEIMELYDIMVYVDIAKCDKSLYENLDMSLIKRNPPRKVWFKEDKYILDYYNRVYLSKNKDFINSGKSYEDYMFDSGWNYSYDCGQYLFEY